MGLAVVAGCRAGSPAADAEETWWEIRRGGAILGREVQVERDREATLELRRELAWTVEGHRVDRRAEVVVDLDPGGRVRALDGRPVGGDASPRLLERAPLEPVARGEPVEVEVVDPWSGRTARINLVPVPGRPAATWLLDGLPGEVVVDDRGRVVEVSAGGLRSRRVQRRPELPEPPPDLVALFRLPVGPVEGARRARTAVFRVEGPGAVAVPGAPPLQRVEGDRVTVQVPLPAEIPRDPVRAGVHELPPGAPDPELAERARRVIGDATDRWTAVQRLSAHVRSEVRHAPVAGAPVALEALARGEGSCDDRAAALAELARAAGIPSRITWGLVYRDDPPGMVPHAWAEVRTGWGWVPVDPALGQEIADATHLLLGRDPACLARAEGLRLEVLGVR